MQMDKKLWKKILLYLIIFLIIIFTVNWLVKSGQTRRNKNQAENFNGYYKNLLAGCQNKDAKLYACCFDSVAYMANNNFQQSSAIRCNPGFKLNTFNCPGAYKWCEMIR